MCGGVCRGRLIAYRFSNQETAMPIQLDHTGPTVTLGSTGSGTLTKYLLPRSGSAGAFLKINTVSNGVGTLTYGPVNEVPTGGTTGFFLQKTAGGYDWASVPEPLPTGGTTGQVLAKTSNSNYAVAWTTPTSAGGIGGALDFGTIDPNDFPVSIVDLGGVAESVSTSPLTLQLLAN